MLCRRCEIPNRPLDEFWIAGHVDNGIPGLRTDAGEGVIAGAVGIDELGSLRNRVSARQAGDTVSRGQRRFRNRMAQPGRSTKNENLHGFEPTGSRRRESDSVL